MLQLQVGALQQQLQTVMQQQADHWSQAQQSHARLARQMLNLQHWQTQNAEVLTRAGISITQQEREIK